VYAYASLANLLLVGLSGKQKGAGRPLPQKPKNTAVPGQLLYNLGCPL